MSSRLTNKRWLIQLLLLIISFCIYTFYFQHLALHLNSVLFKIEGDSLKNYYTFVYHIKNDSSTLGFSGMNFPFGEHIVYTDCQPLITFILRSLPFTHDYLVGIMHGLILASFIITPLILFRIFTLLDVEDLPAFFFSLGIALLSPQIRRLGGHFALAYGCVIPLAILYLLYYLKSKSYRPLLFLSIYNCSLFLIHPYLGLGISVFCFTTLLLYEFIVSGKRPAFQSVLKIIGVGIAPIVLFKLFMAITDHHTQRPTEAFGPDIMTGAASFKSIFVPFFGPFDHFMQSIFRSKKYVEWETCSYLGFFPTLLLFLSIITLPFYYRKVRLPRELVALSITALLFLVFAFGVHISISRRIHLNFDTLNQFRVLARFAWYFYFLLPIFLAVLITQVFKVMAKESVVKFLVLACSILFCSFNMMEAGSLFKDISKNAFNSRNIFNASSLTNGEKKVIAEIKNKKTQAILPMPLFHVGSEVYQRNGDKSISTSFLYSYHTGLPILGVMLSRTSLPETEESIELLNIYKTNRRIKKLLSEDPILVIQTGTDLKEDEDRILRSITPFAAYDSLQFYYAGKSNFELNESDKSKFVILNSDKKEHFKNTIYIPYENRQPFLRTRIDDFEKIAGFDSSTFENGKYIVSFRYHLTGKKFRNIYSNLIVEKFDHKAMNWAYYTSVRSVSGFYDSVIVFEHKIKLESAFGYRFLLKGGTKEYYKVSDFLIRPENLDIKIISKGQISYNNYPN